MESTSIDEFLAPIRIPCSLPSVRMNEMFPVTESLAKNWLRLGNSSRSSADVMFDRSSIKANGAMPRASDLFFKLDSEMGS